MKASAVRTLVVVAILLASCKKSVPPVAPSGPVGGAIEVGVQADGGWLYTYLDPSGKFETVDKVDAIPGGVRRVVRASDPSASAVGDRLWVINADELVRRGHVKGKSMSRPAFETAAMVQLGPGESSPRGQAPSASDPAAINEPAAAGDPSAIVVTLYGASWCGACKSARKYLVDHKIPFRDLDIEKNPAAAAELAEKAGRLGVPADRIPVLEVRGRLLVGFDPARLQALLGQPT